MSPVLRRLARSAGLFGVLLVFAAWPRTSVREAASAGVSALLDPMLARITFGDGGRAVLRPAPVVEVRRPGEHVSSDAVLLLGSEPVDDAKTLRVGMSIRRDFYLPLVLFTVAVVAAPVSARRRLRAFLVGAPLAFLSCCAFLFATICWVFALEAPAVYPLSPAALRLLDTFASTFLLPPALRMFTALVIAAAALWWLGATRPSPNRSGN